MSVIVYAYGGCGSVVSGKKEALAEIERCARFWDRLVEIDREIERCEIIQARSDMPEMESICADIDSCNRRLVDAPQDKKIRYERRSLFIRRRFLLVRWRRQYKDAAKTFKSERINRVTELREHDQDSGDALY